MKLLIDFLPVAIFFLIYKMAPELINALSPWLSLAQAEYLQATPPIILATAVLIPATLLQILYTKISTGKVEKMHLITLVLVVVLGGATVALQNKEFIMWKPTLVNWLFALAFLASQLFMKKSFLQRMMEANLQLPDQVWKYLNYAWVSFFTFSGLLNLIVAYNFSENTWVNFKLFGLLGLTLIFIIGQSLFLYKYIVPKDS